MITFRQKLPPSSSRCLYLSTDFTVSRRTKQQSSHSLCDNLKSHIKLFSIFLLSSHQAWRLCRVISLHKQGHPETTTVFRKAMKGTHCTCLQYTVEGMEIAGFLFVLGKWPTWCTYSFLCIYFYLLLSTCFEDVVLIIRREILYQYSLW